MAAQDRLLDRFRWWVREVVDGHRLQCESPDGRQWTVWYRPTYVDGTLPIATQLRAAQGRKDRWFTGEWGVVFARWGGMWLLEARTEDLPATLRCWIVAGSLEVAARNAREIQDRIRSGATVDAELT